MSSIRLAKFTANNISFESGENIISTDVQSAIEEVSDDVLIMSSTALLTPISMIINANPALFDIPAFTAVFIDNYTNPLVPTKDIYEYPGSTGNSLTNLATEDATFISVSKTGVLLQGTNLPTSTQLKDYVNIGGLTHQSRTQIDYVNKFTATVATNLACNMYDLGNSLGPINRAGNTPSGNLSNTLRVNKTSGESFQVGVNFVDDPKSPNIKIDASTSAADFFLGWRDGAGGFTAILTNTLTPSRYDNNTTGGILTPNGILLNNKWQIFKVFHIIQSNRLVFEVGQSVYSSLSEAIANKGVSTISNPSVAPLKFRGWYAVRGNCIDLNDTDSAQFIDAGRFSQTTEGGALGTSTTTIQGAYNNSITPEILTDSTRGALTIKNGQVADTSNVFEGQNIAGTTTFAVTGSGQVSATKLTVTSTTNGIIFPRMTTTQKNAVTAIAGEVVYDTTLNKLCVYNGAVWQIITSV